MAGSNFNCYNIDDIIREASDERIVHRVLARFDLPENTKTKLTMELRKRPAPSTTTSTLPSKLRTNLALRKVAGEFQGLNGPLFKGDGERFYMYKLLPLDILARSGLQKCARVACASILLRPQETTAQIVTGHEPITLDDNLYCDRSICSAGAGSILFTSRTGSCVVKDCLEPIHAWALCFYHWNLQCFCDARTINYGPGNCAIHKVDYDYLNHTSTIQRNYVYDQFVASTFI